MIDHLFNLFHQWMDLDAISLQIVETFFSEEIFPYIIVDFISELDIF